MTSRPDQLPLPRNVRSALRSLRRRIRMYACIEGLAILVAVAGVAFWLGLAFDWLLEPDVTVRTISLGGIGLLLAIVAYRYVLRRLFARLPQRSLALLLERHDKRLADHVATAVHLSATDESAQNAPALVQQTYRSADEAVRHVQVGRLINLRPLMRAVGAATVLAVSVAVFALVAGGTFDFWLQRIALTDQLWPRRVHLEVVGFDRDENGNRLAKVARNDDFEITVRALMTDKLAAPANVELRFRLPDGRRGRDYLTRIGDAVPGRDHFQAFRYIFKNVRNDLEFDLRGGDDRISDLQLQVVDRPQLVRLELECTYPAYLNRRPETIDVTSGLQIPEGSHVLIRAQTNKPLVHVQARSEQGDYEKVQQFGEHPTTEFVFDYGTLSAEDTLLLNLLDTDGISSREPYRVSLAIVPDEPPQIAVNLRGIGSAVTPEAQMPFVGQLTDDYGLQRAWFSYALDGTPPQERPLDPQPTGKTSLEEFPPLDLRARDPATGKRSIAPKPGQKLAVAVEATDHCMLRGQPQVGTSQRFVLEVVTPAGLLAMMERQELALRQRYEATYERLVDTRDLLGRIEFGDPSDKRPQRASEEAPSPADDSSQRNVARRRLRVAGALQNVRQAADEVLGIADGFNSLHDQLVNNRIDNDELMSRLKGQIAEPLWHIGRTRMPELESRLQRTQERISDASQAEPALRSSIALADTLLVEMQHVLDRMLELETYNEVIAMLRDIITDQDQLNDKTKQRRQQRLRSLLED